MKETNIEDLIDVEALRSLCENTNTKHIDLDIEELDYKIKQTEKELLELKRYKEDLESIKTISDKFDKSICDISTEFNFYKNMEDEICKTKKGREFWASIGDIVNKKEA